MRVKNKYKNVNNSKLNLPVKQVLLSKRFLIFKIDMPISRISVQRIKTLIQFESLQISES